MGNLPGLWRRGNIWQYRRRVPSDVARRIGRQIVSYSLNTADYSTATSRCQIASHHLEECFQNVRNGHVKALPTTIDVWHKTVAHRSTIQAPPAYNQDCLLTLIKTAVEEVVGQTLPVKKPSITLSELYRRYMDDPARQRSKKTVMTYESVFKVLIDKTFAEVQYNTPKNHP
jgi:hypothetical protein